MLLSKQKQNKTNLRFYFTNLFPNKRLHKIFNTKFNNTIVVGIGGNVGNTIQTFHKLVRRFDANMRFCIVQTSPILQNPPFGYLKQDDFYNAIVVIKTNLSPLESLKAFQYYEKSFKRKRTFKNAPRTLDIDIIFFNNVKFNHKKLQIPHLYYKQRDSVVLPLRYIGYKV